ncbi:MAG TPA: hypothetical protein VEA81_08800, partial [Burkholderiaceae bacterium]|nr:hypothetical protein [Burkholderiaceae bacterium]
MAFLIEQTSRGLGTQRTPVGPELTRITVRPGDVVRFVDAAGGPVGRMPRLRLRRLGDDLLLDGLPEGRTIELDNFYAACRADASCSVSIDGLGAPRGLTITEATASRG